MKGIISFCLIGGLVLSLASAEESAPASKPSPKPAAAAAPVSSAHKQPEKWIGINAGPVPEMVRAQVSNLPEGQGLLVFQVNKESPALAAGLERFDLIVRADGEPVGTPQDLQQALNKRNFGTQVRLDLIRKGAAKQLYVIVLEKPEGEGEGGHPHFRNWFGQGNLKPENVTIQFSYTDASGQKQTLGAKTMAEFGQRAQQDETFRNQLQQMFQGFQQNPAGITIQLKPADKETAVSGEQPAPPAAPR